jgi:hypothetical protein
VKLSHLRSKAVPYPFLAYKAQARDMAKSYQQIFGQLANSYLNFANPLAKNHTRYGQLPSQGPAACNPYTSTPSYASNEPTPLIPQKFGVNAQHHSEYSAKPNYKSS